MFQKSRHRPRALTLACLALSLLLLPAGTLADEPAGCGAFTELSYDEARWKAEDQGLVFLVYATASWCAPCQRMQQTTWQDEELIALIHQLAVVYRLDVDKERTRALEHDVQALPTMIAYRDGEEFERILGARDADHMMAWIGNVKKGERTVAPRAPRAAPDAVDPNEKDAEDIQQRLESARRLLRTRQLDEATEEFLWLWQNMLEHSPSMYGVRLSFFIGDLKRLFAAHEPARQPFAKLRDELETRMGEGRRIDREEIVDWKHLSQALGEEDRPLEWYEAHKDNPELREIVRQLEPTVYNLLVARNRWSEAGRLVRNPQRRIQRELRNLDLIRDLPEHMDDERVAGVQQRMLKWTRESGSRLYTSLLAADRHESAELVARALLERMESPETLRTLLETTLDAGFVHEHQLAWLEEAAIAEIEDEAVRRALERHGETIREKLPRTM